MRQQIREAEKRLIGAHLNIGTIHRPPFVIKTSTSKEYFGAAFEFVKFMSNAFNFSYSVVESPRERWGKLHENGTWDGLVGMLLNGQIDLSATSLTINYERAQVISFLPAFHHEPTTILLPRSTLKRVNSFALSKPFEAMVWLVLGLSILVQVTLICFIMFRISPNYLIGQGPRMVLLRPIYYAFESLDLTLPTLLRMPPSLDGTRIKHISLRINLTSWWLAASAICSVYTSEITAILLAPQYHGIHSLSDLVMDGSIPWTYVDSSVHSSLFSKSSKTEIYRKVGIRAAKLVNTSPEGIDMVINHGYAFIKEKTYLQYMVAAHCSDQLLMAREEFFPMSIGMGTRSQFEHFSVFAYWTQWSYDLSIWSKWKRQYKPRATKCLATAHHHEGNDGHSDTSEEDGSKQSTEDNHEDDYIRLPQLSSVFIYLLSFHIIIVLTLGAECLFSLQRRKNLVIQF